MSQFVEPAHTMGKCPICGKPVLIRSTRGGVAYCSRVCASKEKFANRYRGTMSGPMDRPKMIDKNYE